MPGTDHPKLERKTFWSTLITRIFLGAASVALVTYVVVSMITLTAVRHQQVQNAPKVDQSLVAAQRAEAAARSSEAAAKSSQALLKIVHDCQKPGTPCNEKTQTNQANLLEIVKRYVVFSGMCSRTGATSFPVQDMCIDRLIGRYGLGPGN